jgi:N-acyl-D-aspartate/D-glutamate deacylase
MGNCGVGFAPTKPTPEHHDWLIGMLEGVEDIPGTALAEGIRWSWESFPEYMDAIARTPRAIDVAAQVVHDPLRIYVMGERALAGQPATEADMARMRDLVREALDAGAVGFTTGRTDNHRAKDGSATPASDAGTRELEAIGSAFVGVDHGVLQAVSDFDMEASNERFDGEFDVLERMAVATRGKPLSISLLQRDLDTEQWRRIVRRAEIATERGVPMRLQVAARGIGVLLGFEATFHPFIGFPSYKKIAHLPLSERVSAMRDPAFKARLLAETSDKIAGDGSNVPPMADRFLANIDFIAMRIFRLGERPNYEPRREDSLFAEAMQRGVRPLEVVYDALLENDGKELLYFPVYNYSTFDLSVVGEMLSHPLALPGLGDGGAHVGTICDGSFPTFMLTHWARDPEAGGLGLPRVVKMLARDTARYMGFSDRGLVAPGQRADLNVVDLGRLRLERPRLVADLPAGGKRLLQAAEGYRATIVRGEPIVLHGARTDAMPGGLLRLGANAR